MRAIAVYKTNVDDRSKAKMIVDAICRHFPGCDVSFDLEDCDNVLRVEHVTDGIEETGIRNILQDYGYRIEILP